MEPGEGARALTPDGFVSACGERCDGRDPDDPFLADTCAGGGASRAHARTDNALARDEDFRVTSLMVNPSIMADLAEGKLLPDDPLAPRFFHFPAAESDLAEGSGGE